MSVLLPPFRPQIGYDEALAIVTRELAKDAGVIDSTILDTDVISLGLRGYYPVSMGPTAANDVGVFDDAVAVINLTAKTVTCFNWNTDPSRLGYNKSLDKDYAILSPGIWWFHKGQHKGKGRAWRQMDTDEAKDNGLKRLYVPNDFRANGTFSVNRGAFNGPSERGYFAINQHWADNNSTSSWGCQTAPGTPDSGQWLEYQKLTYSLTHSLLPYILTTRS